MSQETCSGALSETGRTLDVVSVARYAQDVPPDQGRTILFLVEIVIE